jgi:hypothetical protein
MKKIILGMAFAILTISACKKEQEIEITGSGKLKFEFENAVNNTPLVLNTQNYINALGESFNVSMFKYYVSNLELTKADGSIYKVPENYFLIDQSVTSSLKKELSNIPAGDYTNLSFTIGVDSARNFSGAQTDALAPENGMFWTWNSGYIFVRMEGSSPASSRADKKLLFHIGGAKSPTNTIRKTSITLNPNVLRVRTDKAPEIHLKVNVASMFTGTQNVSFSQYNFMHGGAPAVLIANNYANDLINLDHIHN